MAQETQGFELRPFAPATDSAIAISGTVQRSSQFLKITYRLEDPQSRVVYPTPVQQPTRQDNLWETTCFEFFLGIAGGDRYWEFNLSPAGHWNLYRFEDYRQGMMPETDISQIPTTLEPHQLSVALDLSLLGAAEADLELGVTAVIETNDGGVSYWAIAHTGPEADFHRRDSFALKL